MPAASDHPDKDPSAYAAQIDHFLDCILENCQPACSGRQGLRDMIILDAAYESAHSGLSVSPRPYLEFERS
jgi:predicted dehydrogenase